MSIVDRVESLENRVEEITKAVGVQDERVSGRGGVQPSLDALRISLKADISVLGEEVKALKRALWTVGGGVVLASIGFGFSVLQLVN
jgi:hypothetical protein